MDVQEVLTVGPSACVSGHKSFDRARAEDDDGEGGLST